MPQREQNQSQEALRVKAGILPRKFSNMHTAESVQWAVDQAGHRGEEISQKPREIKATYVGAYLDSLDGRHGLLGGNAERRERQIAHHVIKPEDVPESYFEAQQRIAREQGHGDVHFSEKRRAEMTATLITDQKVSLGKWVEYLNHPDAGYPTWFKYFALQGILQLGQYNKETNRFSKRTKHTVAPFGEIKREALAIVYSDLKKVVDSKDHQDLQIANFGNLYTQAIERSSPKNPEQRKVVTGEWVKYAQGRDDAGGERAQILAGSLQGYGTGWCTSGEATAEKQLADGDFHVFYSDDEKGEANIPRVAIRMEGRNIAEVRGIGPAQSLEPALVDTAATKLATLGGAERYRKKATDMQMLTTIETKHNVGEELSVAELRFLYELDNNIEGFGYDKDPRVYDIQTGRDRAQDLARVLDIDPDQIATSQSDIHDGTVVLISSFHSNNWKREAIPPSLKYVLGSVTFYYPDGGSSVEDLGNLEKVRGDVTIAHSSIKTLGSLKSVGGELKIGKETEDLGELQFVGQDLILRESKLQTLGKVVSVGKNVDIVNSDVVDLGAIKTVQGSLYLAESNVTSLGNVEYIGGEAFLFNSFNLVDLGKLRHIGGPLNISGTQITDISGLQYIGGESDSDLRGNDSITEEELRAVNESIEHIEDDGITRERVNGPAALPVAEEVFVAEEQKLVFGAGASEVEARQLTAPNIVFESGYEDLEIEEEYHELTI